MKIKIIDVEEVIRTKPRRIELLQIRFEVFDEEEPSTVVASGKATAYKNDPRFRTLEYVRQAARQIYSETLQADDTSPLVESVIDLANIDARVDNLEKKVKEIDRRTDIGRFRA